MINYDGEEIEIIKKIPVKAFYKFQIEFLRNKRTDRKMYLGREFLFEFFPEVYDKDLLFTKDNGLARDIIFKYYIEPIKKGE